MAVRFSPDGKLVATGSTRGGVQIWSAETGKLVAEIVEHTLGINDLRWGFGGKKILTASNDRTLKLFDVETQKA